MTDDEKAERAARRQAIAKAVGERIQWAREAAGITSKNKLAEMIGTHGGWVSRAEAGKRIPDPIKMRELADALGVRQEWLTTGDGPISDTPDRPGVPLASISGFDEAMAEARERWPERFRADSWELAGKWTTYPTPKRVDLLYLQPIVQFIESRK